MEEQREGSMGERKVGRGQEEEVREGAPQQYSSSSQRPPRRKAGWQDPPTSTSWLWIIGSHFDVFHRKGILRDALQ